MIHRSGYFTTDSQFPGIGYIFFSDGNQTQPLVTKRHALEMGEALLGINITNEEWLIIKQQIHESTLISRSTRLEELANTASSAAEEIVRVIEPLIAEMKKLQEEQRLADWWKNGDEPPTTFNPFT